MNVESQNQSEVLYFNLLKKNHYMCSGEFTCLNIKVLNARGHYHFCLYFNLRDKINEEEKSIIVFCFGNLKSGNTLQAF